MLSKQELYDLIPMDYKETKGLDTFTYMCVDEALGIYTVDYNYHVWSGSYDQKYYAPDYIVFNNKGYYFAFTPHYDSTPYDGIIKIVWGEDGVRYFSEQGQRIIPKEVSE